MSEIVIPVHYQGEIIHVTIRNPEQQQGGSGATVNDLQEAIYNELSIAPENQKLMAGKAGFLKSPNETLESVAQRQGLSSSSSSELSRLKITVFGARQDTINQLQQDAEKQKAESNRLAEILQRRKNKRPPILKTSSSPASQFDIDKNIYTFYKVEPLPGLPHGDEAIDILQRLKNDCGIQKVMVKHKFRVGLLTELDPASNTSHESKTLGLNQNHGQTIFLRLRTDWYKGWRDYKSTRLVLCHELAHNIYGDHDSNFWKLCKQLEREVVELDPFGKAGHALSNMEFAPTPQEPDNDVVMANTDDDPMFAGFSSQKEDPLLKTHGHVRRNNAQPPTTGSSSGTGSIRDRIREAALRRQNGSQ